MSQKQTLSLNAVIDLIQTSGHLVRSFLWSSRSRHAIVHSAPQDTRGFAMLPETKFGCQKIVVFADCQMPIVFGIR